MRGFRSFTVVQPISSPPRSSTEGMALSTFALTPGFRCSEK